MWTIVREHLVLKIAGVLALTLVIGFALPSWLGARVQQRELERSGHDAAQSVARGLAAGMRTAMLAGNGLTARSMVRDVRERLSTAQVRIYAPDGEEVFGAATPPPARDTLPAHIREVLGDRKGHAVSEGAGADAVPIVNEPRCRRCHDEGELRGVLTIGTQGAAVTLDGGEATLAVLDTIARSAFEQIMTAEKEDLLDDYFEELSTVDGLSKVAVVDPDGRRSFGPDSGVAATEVVATLAAGTPRTVTIGTDRVRIVPLDNEPQCHGCHDAEARWRGALVTRSPGVLTDARKTALVATDVSLRHVMLSGLGRMIARFVDEVAATGAFSSLTVHDAEGRLFRDAFTDPSPSSAIAEALRTGTEVSSMDEDGDSERFVFVAPLSNDVECQRCHGGDLPVRGAIEVVLDTSAAAEARRKVTMTGIIIACITIVVTVVILYFGLRMLVVRPVSEMGAIADRVGGGLLDSRVDVRSIDEIGRLGQRLNHMIGEIRKKIELSKFVSKATVGSVDAAESTVERRGRRTRSTVLFSDIRGFTAFSETVEPEAVVEMLNAYLDAQANAVEVHGGDIDKFVGDELMAHFHDQNMEARAVAAALDMIDAVAELNRVALEGSRPLEVGIGINVGEMVFGAMGARARMDFTVIGDAVNLGARLCSAATPGQVVVSAAIVQAVGALPGVEWVPLEPIMVKGKREPIQIFAARRSSNV